MSHGAAFKRAYHKVVMGVNVSPDGARRGKRIAARPEAGKCHGGEVVEHKRRPQSGQATQNGQGLWIPLG